MRLKRNSWDKCLPNKSMRLSTMPRATSFLRKKNHFKNVKLDKETFGKEAQLSRDFSY